MSETPALSQMLRRSAASTGTRAGRTVPLHFGSAAGELALCVRSVGLAHREDLSVLAVRGDEPALDLLTAERLGHRLAPGEAATAAGVHWARRAARELLAVGSPATLLPLQGLPASGLDVRLEVLDLTAIGLVGPGTQGLLFDLGIYGSVSAAPEELGRIAAIAGGVGTWLLLDSSFALALVEPSEAVGLWRLLSATGRRFEIGNVGAEAAERFELTRCAPARPRRAFT